MTSQKTPLALIILDGWGYREETKNNAIAAANTPNMDSLAKEYTSTLISGSGLDVGLPEGQMGNSEVGHVNLGAGRVVYQDFTKITKAIKDGEFAQNPAIVQGIEQAVNKDKAVHLLGLLSDGGVHSHQDHIFAALTLAQQKGAKKVYLHAFLDGRDTPPRSAEQYLAEAQQVCDGLDGVEIASIVGRYYAMDRDNRWERISKAYNVIVDAEAEFSAADESH
jgi:2,3-bisphosphoglycerate-independent phosphoglycerate mutase